MSFNEVMALIIPSIIALLFYSKLINRKLTLFDGFGYLAFIMLVTNCLCYGILFFTKKLAQFIFTNSFTMQYSLMATFVAIVFVLLLRFIELNLSINVRVESNNEKN